MLYSSFEKHCSVGYTIFVLAMDKKVVHFLSMSNLKNVVVETIDELIINYPQLEKIKQHKIYNF